MARVKPRARTDLDVVEVEGEAVVYDPSARQAHYLNHSAALVFSLCDGETTIFDMADAIVDVYEMPFDEVDSQVRKLLRDLRQLGILEGSAQTPAEAEPSEEEIDERGRIRIKVPQST
jgi:Coenzyme PQQ synthesis protein D (PqqD)